MKYIEKVLEFELLDIGKYTLSVYNLLLVIIIFFAVKGITHTVDTVLKKRLANKGITDEGRSSSISQIVKYIVYILGFFLMVKSLGINIDLIIGVFAALGLGIGFALQDVFKDLISGIIILFEGNVSVGDILEVDGLTGSVKQIKLRTSLIRTRDGIFMVIPNSKIVNENVVNWSTDNRITRFSIEIGVAYGSDVEKVRGILLDCAKKSEMVSKRPSPVVFFNNFGDSSLEFELNFWVLDTWNIEPTKSDIRFDIDKAFRENNISIPFPQRVVHMVK